MIWEHQRSPSVPSARRLADHRENNSLGVLSHTPAEVKGLATTQPYCQNIVLFYQFYLPWNLWSTRPDFSHVSFAFTSPQFPFLLSPLSTQFLSAIILQFSFLCFSSYQFLTILVSLLFLFLHSANCSPVSVLLLFLQILYLIILPFIPGLLTQSSFFYTMFSTIQCTIQTALLP